MERLRSAFGGMFGRGGGDEDGKKRKEKDVHTRRKDDACFEVLNNLERVAKHRKDNKHVRYAAIVAAAGTFFRPLALLLDQGAQARGRTCAGGLLPGGMRGCHGHSQVHGR